MINRRSFLRNLSFTGSLLTMPAALVKAGATDDGVASGAATRDTVAERVCHGRVHDGGKGIADVAVTDGYSIVKTDKDGKYELTAHPAAEFVYISVPSGYHFPEQRYI